MKFNPLTLAIGKILAFWNDPIRMQAMILVENTNWPGDMYALVQRFKTVV
jgi:hypothetical protein